MVDPSYRTLGCFDKMWVVWLLKKIPIPKDIQLYIWHQYLTSSRLFNRNHWEKKTGYFSFDQGWISSSRPSVK